MDFKNTVIILTSNIGSHYYSDPISIEESFEITKQKVLDEVRMHFRPEFINRLDDIVIFHSLGVNEIKQIVTIQLQTLTDRLAERRIKVSLTERASQQLASTGYDPIYGARPLKRAIQRDVVNPLAQALLRGDIREGSNVAIDYREGSFVFENLAASV